MAANHTLISGHWSNSPQNRIFCVFLWRGHITFSSKKNPALLLYPTTGWDHSTTEDHGHKRLQSPSYVTPALQNQGNCLSDTKQNHLDTEQSIQVWSSTWCPLLLMWRNWNHGAPALLLWALLGQNLGPSWEVTHPCSLSSFWGIYPSCGPHPSWNRFQQTTSVNTSPHPGCHYTQSTTSPPTRD
jgi:hypothetical protein